MARASRPVDACLTLADGATTGRPCPGAAALSQAESTIRLARGRAATSARAPPYPAAAAHTLGHTPACRGVRRRHLPRPCPPRAAAPPSTRFGRSEWPPPAASTGAAGSGGGLPACLPACLPAWWHQIGRGGSTAGAASPTHPHHAAVHRRRRPQVKWGVGGRGRQAGTVVAAGTAATMCHGRSIQGHQARLN